MARSSSGKWVARAGATGHSRTYRGQTPVNWYAALVVIVLLGVLSVLWASYEYRHPFSTGTTSTEPTTKTTWYAGITFDVCGTTQPPLASNAATASKSGKGIFTGGSGVITVAPKTSKQAGKNAVLDKFVSAYPGLGLTTTGLTLPTGKKSESYKNGATCPKGTPDAGKKGDVSVVYWSSAFTNKAISQTVTGDPGTLRFSDNQLITVGFVPSGTKLGKNVKVVEALLHVSTGSASTTSTATSAPTSTSTSAPATTATTAPPSTSTSAPATTTTSPHPSSTSTTTKK